MEYSGLPTVRGRGMVKWNPFTSMPEQYEECDLNHNFAVSARLWFLK
ncbi:hypothetical protein P4T53_25790 [Bacillus paramycoides]|nr:hypothetical protein [Bacillus paramycoides]